MTYDPENTTDDKTVIWTSDNAEIATVDENGMVFGYKAGTAHIVANVGTFSAETEVTVTEIPLTDIYFETELNELLKGQSTDLKKYLVYNPVDTTDSKTAVWASSDDAIAIVDENGVVTGLKEGTVMITAQVGALNAVIELMVKEIPLESIAFDKVVEKMKVGEEVQLNILYNPSDTTDEVAVEWSSSDVSVVEIENGHLIAKKGGTAIITAKAGEQTISMEITVEEEKKPTDEEDKDETDEKPSNPSDPQENDKNQESDTTDKSKQNEVTTGDKTDVARYIIMLLAAADMLGMLMIVRRRVNG